MNGCYTHEEIVEAGGYDQQSIGQMFKERWQIRQKPSKSELIIRLAGLAPSGSTSSITGLGYCYLYVVTILRRGLGDDLHAQKISLARILRCSVFRLRWMRLSRPSHSLVRSNAWQGEVV